MSLKDSALSLLDRVTGANLRARRRIVREVVQNPSISQRQATRIVERIGGQEDESLRRWESARTNRLNSAHWSMVDGQPINAELSAWQNNLRHRSENELANNSLIEGLVNTYQLCVVGSEGPRLSVLSSDADYAVRRSKLWEDWCRTAGSNQQLSLVEILDLWVRALFGGGEFFNQLVTVDADGPIKTRLLPIHTHRLMTPPEFLGRADVALGVRRDLNSRRPVAYYVSQPYIFGAFEVYNGDFLEIPYGDAIHGFRMIEEDQVRGVPWLATCLGPAADLRDFKTETLDAARAAADAGVILSTDHPDAPYIQTNSEIAVHRRTISNAPPGWKPFQMEPSHPGPQYDDFYESLARELGGPVCMPLMMILLDSSNHNYSSARFDGQIFWRGVAKHQGWLGRMLLRIESIIALEAELAGELPAPPADVRRRLNWPTAPHVDPTKERTADRMGLENGDLTYSELCARAGRTREEVIAERKGDNDALAAAGLAAIPGIPGKADVPQSQDDGSDDEPRGKKAQAKRNGSRFPLAGRLAGVN